MPSGLLFADALRTDPARSATERIAFSERTILRIIAVTFLIQIVWSWPLWHASRFFPVTPAFEGVPMLGPPWDLLLVAFLCAALAASAFRPFSTPAALGILGATVMLALLDATRWQPWVLQYTLIIVVLLGSKRGDARGLYAVLLVVGFGYMWSGAYKIGSAFAESGLVTVLSAFVPSLPNHGVMLWLGNAAALGEMLMGLGLLLARTRYVAGCGLIAMHVALLAALGPLGLAINTIIWPWNVALILVLLVLVDARSELRMHAPTELRFRAISWRIGAACLLAGVFPFLHGAAGLPDYLAFSLYSGRHLAGVIHISAESQALLPSEIAAFVDPDDPYKIDVNRWSDGELGVPIPSYRPIYRRVFDQICAWSDDSWEIGFEMVDPSHTYGDGTPERTVCG